MTTNSDPNLRCKRTIRNTSELNDPSMKIRVNLGMKHLRVLSPLHRRYKPVLLGQPAKANR